MSARNIPAVDRTDREIIAATQAGLPLVPEPYQEIAQRLGLAPPEVMARMKRMQKDGVIRRIGVVPNHYALGILANGMTVWDVGDAQVSELGREVGALAYVSHCYHRPRRFPVWPYNLFAMVHGTTREDVEAKAAEISHLLGDSARGHDIIYSKRILKKTGMRILMPR